MMTAASLPTQSFPVRRVPLSRPFTWIRLGWDDLLHHRGASLAYGWLVSSLGALILAYNNHPYFVAIAVVAFLVVGPMMTAGVCELSRHRERREPANFQTSLQTLQDNRAHLLHFAGRLIVFGGLWIGLCGAILYAITGSVAPDLSSTLWSDMLPQLSAMQILFYTVGGALLAGLVFAVSVVAVPLIIDRDVDVGSAMRTSLHVAWSDFPAMLVWGALILVMVGIGFATYLIGMVVIFPLLGHATWYAYRDLIK